MQKTAAIGLLALAAAMPAAAQSEAPPQVSGGQPAVIQSSSEKVRDKPAAQ